MVFFPGFFNVPVFHRSSLIWDKKVKLFFYAKKWVLFFFFCESHGFAFAIGTVLLSRESRPCLSKAEKTHIFCFFPFARGTVLLPREARPCFSETNVFSVFFLPSEARFCFHERRGCALMRGTAVPLGNG